MRNNNAVCIIIIIIIISFPWRSRSIRDTIADDQPVREKRCDVVVLEIREKHGRRS